MAQRATPGPPGQHGQDPARRGNSGSSLRYSRPAGATAGGPFLAAPDPPGQQRENWCAERHTRPAGATAGVSTPAQPGQQRERNTSGAPIHTPGPPGQQREIKRARRYLFALYPTAEQKAVLQRHSEMLADLWNGLLQRYEHIQRTTTQRQVWFDTAGRHSGVSYHRLTWGTYRKAEREAVVIEPGANGRPKPFTAFDMQNEITALLNELPEWKEMSVWCCHRTATKLSLAIEAFYARAKKGKGAQSGYPHYRRRSSDRLSVPHRFASGCRLTKDPRHANSWQLTLKGIPGKIHARGCFPFAVPSPSGPQRKDWADADVIWRNGKWSVSVCVKGQRSRSHGYRPVTIRFDLIAGFALVDNYPEEPPGLIQARLLQDRLADRQSDCDRLFPRGRVRRDEPDYAELRLEISRLAARIARVRANALHTWTAGIVARASAITVIAPPLEEDIRTPHGDAKSWGAHVEVVSAINREALAQAPGVTIRMLQYKAAEAGIACHVVTDPEPPLAVGRELVTAGKTLRRARRAHREEMAHGL